MQQAVGVFDSGVGGLSVLKHIHELLPSESLIYVADSAYMPYGCKAKDVVLQRVLTLADYFASCQVKAMVVACNTATAVAIEALRARYKMPIIGMEPAVKPAVVESRSGVVGVLATTGTIGSEKFNRLKAQFADQAEVIVMPCPGLVERIEAGDLDSAETCRLLQNYLEPMLAQGMDRVVLGCTHYPYLKPQIRRLLGDDVAIIDAGDAIARQLQRQLDMHGLMADSSLQGEIRFVSTAAPDPLLFSRLWGSSVSVSEIQL